MEESKIEVEQKKKMVKASMAKLTDALKKDTVDMDAVEVYMELHESRYNDLDFATKKYLSVLAQAGNPSEYATVDEDFGKTQEEYMMTMHKAGKVAKTSSSSTTTQPAVQIVRDINHKENLVMFAGDAREWLGFWACFELIHQDAQKKVPEKFKLLRQSMEPGSDAHRLVYSYPMLEDNYQKAIDHLHDRFGRPSVLIKVYVRELLKLIMENSSGKKGKFSEIVTQVASQVRNLDSLGVTQDMCAQVLFPVVECCLPDETMLAWQRSGQPEDLEKLIEFLDKEVNRQSERNLARNQFGNLGCNSSQVKNEKGKKEANKASPSSTMSFAANEGKSRACIFCERDHHPRDCKKALNLSMEDKQELLKRNKRCFKCLVGSHFVGICKMNMRCELCQKSHYEVMCSVLDDKKSSKGGSGGASRNKEDDKKKVSFREDHNLFSTSLDMKATGYDSDVPLETLYTFAFGRDGLKRRVRVMFDSGCQRSYILEDIANELKLEYLGEETVVHELFGGIQSPPTHHDIVKIFLGPKDGSSNGNFAIRTSKEISRRVISPPPGSHIQEFAKHGVIFSDFGSDRENIDILIGGDVRANCFTGRKLKLCEGPGPIAAETIWGWVLTGKCPSSNLKTTGTMMVTNLHIADRPIADLWSLKTIGIRDSADKESREELDRQATLHFCETFSRHEDGRYEVELPWLQGMKERLPNNYWACWKRLKTTTASLQKSGYLLKYNEVFQQWLQEGIIELVTEEGDPHEHRAQYLPHRAVIKLSSVTTPVRPVFDASAKLKGHPSLNECVDKGANTLELIPSILTRFRLYKIGVVADIRKAFQQISVVLEDRDFLRFIWWDGVSCQNVVIYRHTRVPFGVSASPFLLGVTLQHHIKQECKIEDKPQQHISGMNPEPGTASTHPAGWVQPSSMDSSEEGLSTPNMLIRNMYVDNVVTSVPGMKAAKRFQKESLKILASAKFELRDWEFGPAAEEKLIPVLGLIWNILGDTLQIDISAAKEKLEDGKRTQRTLLSLAHCLFDPLGVISPFTLEAKLLLRSCHELKLGWDTPLPTELQKEVDKWACQIPHLDQLYLPRYTYFGEAEEVTLHIFCDASAAAYAAVAFFRSELEDSVEVSFVQARSRVAPKKACTIPRLELTSCLIGARLAKTIIADIGKELPMQFWTDSSTALAWITGGGPWGVFVNNRKAEINALTDMESWSHIPGKVNPADLPSRGCGAKRLVELEWWRGPPWLHSPEAEWPKSENEVDRSSVEAEMRKTVVSCTSTESSFGGLLRLSNYGKILRVLGNAVKFKKAIFEKLSRDQLKEGENGRIPSVIEEAEYALLRYVQQELPKDPKHLLRLRPFVDNFGVTRTRTRLTHEDDEDFKCPIILPQKNEFVELLIRWEHEKTCHIGTEMLLAHLRDRFWILQGRRAVRKVVDSCWICKRYLTRQLEVPEAPLPPVRTGLGRPFSVVGVDAAGPMTLKNKTKVWLILFTCAVYRAVHLEVVEALSTDSFLRAFRHFISRRARPEIVISDNGLNFVGAQRAISNVDWKKVEEFAELERISWRFSIATASWFGGFWERMIGVVKGLLRKMLGTRVVHLHELVSLCVDVEEAVNNRPLTYITEDPGDPRPLTPNHFVKNLEAPAAGAPELDVLDGQHLRAAFRKLQHLREALRSRFRNEYLGQLLHHNGKGKTMTLKEGDVVIIHHPNMKRQDWQLGVIMTPIPSRTDKIPRSYRVKTKGGEIERPAQHLFPMEISEEDAAPLRDLDKDDEGDTSNDSAQST